MDLEPTLQGPKGPMPRCQAVKRGKQCGAPAKRGSSYCWRCDRVPSTPDPESEPKKRYSVDRPTTHGLYSSRAQVDIQRLAQEVLHLEADLDNTDKELAVLKATLWYLLTKADEFKDKGDALAAFIKDLEARYASAESGGDNEAAREFQLDIRAAYKFAAALESYLSMLLEAATRVINAAKARAETRAKMAEAKALEHFVNLSTAARNILWEILDSDQVAAFEERLKKEVFAPNGLKLPDLRA